MMTTINNKTITIPEGKTEGRKKTTPNTTPDRVRLVMESPLTYIAVLLLCLLSNITHVASEYKNVTGDSSWLPYSFLLVLDLAVILFAYNGQRNATIVFAIILFLLNLSFFTRSVPLDAEHFRELGVSFLLSAAFSYAIFAFSELFVKRVQKKPSKATKMFEIDVLEYLRHPSVNKQDVADHLEVSKQYVYQIAGGKKSMSKDMKQKLLSYFAREFIAI